MRQPPNKGQSYGNGIRNTCSSKAKTQIQRCSARSNTHGAPSYSTGCATNSQGPWTQEMAGARALMKQQGQGQGQAHGPAVHRRRARHGPAQAGCGLSPRHPCYSSSGHMAASGLQRSAASRHHSCTACMRAHGPMQAGGQGPPCSDLMDLPIPTVLTMRNLLNRIRAIQVHRPRVTWGVPHLQSRSPAQPAPQAGPCLNAPGAKGRQAPRCPPYPPQTSIQGPGRCSRATHLWQSPCMAPPPSGPQTLPPLPPSHLHLLAAAASCLARRALTG
jgi:hypothetical protein